MAGEKPSFKGQAWFCTTGLPPSDVMIEVDDMTFHLHKVCYFLNLSIHNLLNHFFSSLCSLIICTEFSVSSNVKKQKAPRFDNRADFPGGSESFEIAAKFCYGVKIDLSAINAAPLRCAGEYLEMTEEYSEENLISKTEMYLLLSVLKNIKHSVKTLTSCQALLPMAENLGIVQRCVDAIAAKSAASDPSLFGWPVNDGAFFQRLIFAMKSLNLNGEIIDSCLVHYAKKYIPGISRTTRKPSSSSSSVLSQNEQRELLETIVSNLPAEKTSSSDSNATRLLFGLLRTAYILNASDACRITLEKRIGLQLEQATLDDLLIPSYLYLNETLYDVDCVERILEYFLQGIEERSVNQIEGEEENINLRSATLMVVGKSIDGYLSEIASDANLKPEKFYDLAVSLPDNARLYDDGLYRAIDVYFKAHPWILEADREKICGILDWQKLTLEACTHAAQNERLPLRAVVKVLFFEQLHLRHAVAGTLDAGTMLEGGGVSSGGGEEDEERAVVVAQEGGRNTWRAAAMENQVLRVDMDSMRTRVHELERECSTMRKEIEKIDKVGPGGHVEKGDWRTRFGCKFKTQVCDSHQPTVVEARKGIRNRHKLQ